jgi:hypothetical protein
VRYQLFYSVSDSLWLSSILNSRSTTHKNQTRTHVTLSFQSYSTGNLQISDLPVENGGWKHSQLWNKIRYIRIYRDRLCGLVVRVLGYRFGDPGSIPGTTRTKVVGLERGPLSLVSTTEELLDRKVAAHVYKTENRP